MSAAVGAHEGVPGRAVILDYENQLDFVDEFSGFLDGFAN